MFFLWRPAPRLRSALTSLKYEDERFENVSMEFDEARLQPTYRLLWGIPGRSNALNIAQRLGLDSTVVDAARERLGSAEVRQLPSVSLIITLHVQGEGCDSKLCRIACSRQLPATKSAALSGAAWWWRRGSAACVHQAQLHAAWKAAQQQFLWQMMGRQQESAVHPCTTDTSFGARLQISYSMTVDL